MAKPVPAIGALAARLALAVTVVVVALGCEQDGPVGLANEGSRLPPERLATAEDPFEPIPESMQLDPRRVELGGRLFDEPLLSGDGKRRCTDCHDLSSGGIAPGEPKSNHPLNVTGPYNVLTVFNVAFNFRYNWNGKFTTLEQHLGGLMMNEKVMAAGSWPALLARIRPKYDEAFRFAGYAEGVSESAVRDAISTYQRSLVTPNSKFDRHLRGEQPLGPVESAGYALFKEVGCSTCHQGINVGGNLFQRYGVMEDAFGGRDLVESDYGRMLITGRAEDAHVFRVPSLRNVALTAPYFHDGSAATLEAAVEHMGRVQLGYVLTAREVEQIVAFLHTLTGELNGKPLSEDGS